MRNNKKRKGKGFIELSSHLILFIQINKRNDFIMFLIGQKKIVLTLERISDMFIFR